MLNSASTNMLDDKEATKSNIHTLLSSEQGEFLSDPTFGIKLKQYLFDQNNQVIVDILIDEIYEKLTLFIPQIIVNRSDITITQERAKLYATIRVTYKVDFTTDLYQLVLFDEDNQ